MMTTFEELGVPARLTSPLAARGISAPFPIQTASIPDLIQGRDVLGRAPTGSGKTLAFGIPMLMRTPKGAPRRPRAMVLSPTRELAQQIARELQPLARSMGRSITAIYGGVGYEAQRNQLKRGVDIVVATPGRLADLIGESAVSLADVGIVVIDEADRMADMGFMPQVRHLVDQTSPDRQTILFSATLDHDVAELTRRYQHDPVRHEVGKTDDEVAHYFWQVHHSERIGIVAEIIETAPPALIFTRTRHGADKVARQLSRIGTAAAAIHGGRSQGQRNRALKQFTEGSIDALVATDVAARGIHVDGIASVIHFDIPAEPKDYLHRSGRTARAGAGGVVVSLVSPEQLSDLRKLQRLVGFHDAIHDPDNGWLSESGGSRIGERPPGPVVAAKTVYQSRSRRGRRRR
jgi:superfamily II DNA/RNA helicase